MHPILNIATQVVRSAGRELMARAPQAPSSRSISAGQEAYFQRTHDRAMRAIERSVQRSYPEHQVSDFDAFGADSNAETHWFVEPINGRVNFMRRLDQFCTLLAISIDNRLRYGMIVDHFRDGHFHATLNEGCFGNDGRMRTSATRGMAGAVIAMDGLTMLDANPAHACSPRVTGCFGLDLVNVTCGRFDGLAYANTSSAHFHLARLFTREAGGFATTINGGEWSNPEDGLVAGNTYVQRRIVAAHLKTIAAESAA